MAIIVEGGGREDGGARLENHSEVGGKEEEKEGVEEVEEAAEQLEVRDSSSTCLLGWLNWLTYMLLLMSCDLFKCFQMMEQLSGLLSSSLHENASVTNSCEQSSRRYSAPLGQGEMQQELVVKAIRVKKKKKRSRQGKQTDRSTLRVTYSQAGRQVDRQTFEQRDRHADGQTCGPAELTLPLFHRQQRQQSVVREQLFRLHVCSSGQQL